MSQTTYAALRQREYGVMPRAYLSLSKPADDPKGALAGVRRSRALAFADRQNVANSVKKYKICCAGEGTHERA